METANDIKCNLNIFIQTIDFNSFTNTLKSAQIHFSLLKDNAGFNIFHDLASSLINENLILEFLTILLNQFSIKHQQEAPAIIRKMLNSQSNREKSTPLLQAVKHNRRVKNYLETCKGTN